jgi:cytoskeleton protein RodZ
MSTIGDQLKKAREAKGWDLNTASKWSKIRSEQIEDIETNNYARFASPSYARGYVRTYAKTLGLNERQITRQLDGVFEEGGDDVYVTAPPVEYLPEQVSGNQTVSPQRLGLYFAMGLLGLFVVVCGLTLFRFIRSAAAPSETSLVIQTRSAPEIDLGPQPAIVQSNESAVIIPEKNKTSISTPEPTPERKIPILNHKLMLRTTEEVWIRVTSINENGEGTQLHEDLVPAGQNLEFTGPKFTLNFGNPSAVQVILDDKDFGPLSPEPTPKTFSLPQN